MMDIDDARIRQLLSDHNLPADNYSIELLREDLEIIQERLADPPDPPTLPKREAKSLRRAAERVLKTATERGLASPEDLRVVRRLKRKAEVGLLLPSSHGPEPRPWLWASCQLLLETWRRVTTRPDGVWMTDAPSPALAFLVDCCRLIDPTVTESAILRAKKKAGPEESDDERAKAYEEWGQSELARKLREPDL